MSYLEVAVAAPVPTTLTYAPPEGAEVGVGSCVLVPLAGRRVTGYVLGPSAPSPEQAGYAIKPCIRLLGDQPFFPASLVSLYRWVADYYHHPIGEVIRTALPTSPSARSRLRATLTEQGREELTALLTSAEAPAPWLSRLADRGELSPAAVTAVRKEAKDKRLLRSLERQAVLTLTPVLQERGVSEKQETVVTAGPLLTGLVLEQDPVACSRALLAQRGERLKRSQERALTLWWRHYTAGARRPVSRALLNREYSGFGRALPGLIALDLLALGQRQVYRDPFGEEPPYHPPPSALTAEQRAVLSRLSPTLTEPVFSPFLLHGVTGCGKTEVYLQAVTQVLARGRCALVLVPEIALASQLEAQFHSRFSEQLAVVHSGLSNGERFDQWQRILQGQGRVVLGARSAVFAPLEDLGLVIVDEEHESAYKQDDGLCYNGRDLAVVRGKQAGCPVILGSATPSLASFHHARQGKYTLLTMAHRVQHRPLPQVEVVNLAGHRRTRPDLFFSDHLISALHDTLDQGKQSLLFVNRRGFSSCVLCRDCGHVVQCANCKVSLTLHKQLGQMLCHYCGYSRPPDLLCPACGSRRLDGAGLGSERIVSEVEQILPQARVARLDSDTAQNRRHYLTTLKKMRDGEIDVLVGTQMIAKGLHFPGITFVGVVWADSGLGMPDYKAAERTFAQLAQVTGRAGRGDDPGRVIIQTHQPEHYAIRCAQSHDYLGFFEAEHALRQGLFYPPLCRLVALGFSGDQEGRVQAAAQQCSALLKRHFGQQDLVLLGPAPAPLALLRGKVRWNLLLKGDRVALLHQACAMLVEQKNRFCPGSVQFKLDVDPENLM